jgi:hypothetical protein
MKKLILILTLAISAFASANEGSTYKGNLPSYLFVQSTQSGSFNEKKMSLELEAATTIYFSDRPERETGHLKTSLFVDKWNSGKDSFQKNHPNATLSIFTKTGVENAIVELLSVALKGKKLIYQIKILSGKIPKTFQEASLFIDAFPTAVNDQITQI